MSRKTRRNRSDTAPAPRAEATTAMVRRKGRRGLLVGLLVLAVVAVLAVYALRNQGGVPGGDGPATRAAALASEHSPSIGEAGARVHVVEFLDPACETCAQFYPLVKQLIAQNPGRIRVSVRHVAFHEGADYAVRALEASRAQDRYWQALEALLQTQSQWAPHHTVRAELVDPVLARAGVDMQRLAADMAAPEVAQRITRDREDAMALKVTATPEFFVNGRPLPQFGYEPLLALVREELDRSY